MNYGIAAWNRDFSEDWFAALGLFITSPLGNLSAFITAYLRFLGYDAVSMLYGLNSIFYSQMLAIPSLNDYAFTAAKIKNYSYSH